MPYSEKVTLICSTRRLGATGGFPVGAAAAAGSVAQSADDEGAEVRDSVDQMWVPDGCVVDAVTVSVE